MSTPDEITPDAAPEVAPAPPSEPAPSRPKRARKPRSSTPRPEKAPRKPGAPRATTRRPPLGPRVAQAHMLMGFGLSFAPGVPNGQAVGIALAENADGIGEAWENLAKENPRVREVLEKLLTAGAVGQLMMAYLPVMLAAAGKADALAGLAHVAATVAPLHVVVDEPVPAAP